MTSIALFNNKGGVGKTTLVYHLAHMYQRQGQRVLVVDLDPQSNLTSSFLDEEDLSFLWDEYEPTFPDRQESLFSRFDLGGVWTIAQAVEPIIRGKGDIRSVDPLEMAENLWLVPGDLELSRFEDELSTNWTKGFGGGRKGAAHHVGFPPNYPGSASSCRSGHHPDRRGSQPGRDQPCGLALVRHGPHAFGRGPVLASWPA